MIKCNLEIDGKQYERTLDLSNLNDQQQAKEIERFLTEMKMTVLVDLNLLNVQGDSR